MALETPRHSGPFSDHGKCAAGMTKKEFLESALVNDELGISRVVKTYLESAILARALYQAAKAAKRPK